MFDNRDISMFCPDHATAWTLDDVIDAQGDRNPASAADGKTAAGRARVNPCTAGQSGEQSATADLHRLS
jgi:hypothetical protein